MQTFYKFIDTFVPQNVWHDRYRLGDEIGRSLGLMSIVCLVFLGLLPHCVSEILAFVPLYSSL